MNESILIDDDEFARRASSELWKHVIHISPPGDDMNSYLNAAVATEHQQQLISDAVAFRRTRITRTPKAARRRYGR